jgi:hypothetical protein
MFGIIIFSLSNGHNSSLLSEIKTSLFSRFPIILQYKSFYLPLSEEAFQQFQEYNDLIDGLQLSEEPDIWTYSWGSIIFTPSRAYHHLIGSR